MVPTRRVALYALVSTPDQKADLQLDGLRKLAEQRGYHYCVTENLARVPTA